MPDLKENIVKNMLMAPNNIIDDIKKNYFTDGELDKNKILSNNSGREIKSPIFDTTIEYGKNDKPGAIRFKTKGEEEPNIGIILSRKYGKEQMAYMSVDPSKMMGIHFVMLKWGNKTMERNTDLDTRQGRIIFIATNYDPNKSKEKKTSKEKEL